jgi:hypothetical protein
VLSHLLIELRERDNCCRRRRTRRCAAISLQSSGSGSAFSVVFAAMNHLGPERDNVILSKFTAADDAFEHRAPYW